MIITITVLIYSIKNFQTNPKGLYRSPRIFFRGICLWWYSIR